MNARCLARAAVGLLGALAASVASCAGAGLDFPASFVVGRYHLLGKKLESDRTYLGTVEFSRSATGLAVARSIGGIVVHGTAAVEHATADALPVLRIRFEEHGVDYEETCQIHADLDNYARMTCYLYRPGVGTTRPGLEAMFVERASQ